MTLHLITMNIKVLKIKIVVYIYSKNIRHTAQTQRKTLICQYQTSYDLTQDSYVVDWTFHAFAVVVVALGTSLCIAFDYPWCFAVELDVECISRLGRIAMSIYLPFPYSQAIDRISIFINFNTLRRIHTEKNCAAYSGAAPQVSAFSIHIYCVWLRFNLVRHE